MINLPMIEVSKLSKQELLNRAKKHYFTLGLDDGASSLCKWNYKYGLAKIHLAQETLGLEPNATFISTPDETISRNKARWESGYGYGGKLTWNDTPEKLIFVDTKPNACGMLVGGLDELPKPQEIIKNINEIFLEDFYIDDVKIKWDFKKGNHFIDVFKTEQVENKKESPRYTFIIHGSAPELKGETQKGIGLYYDNSKTLREMSQKIETPFGPLYYLEGDNAKDYMEFFKFAKQYAAKKREKAAEKLFGKFKKLSNPMHQGLKNYNELLLGAQYINEPGEKLFPVALRSDLPAYLVTGLPNLTDEQIEDLGFEKRAKTLNVYNRLFNFNTLPHGGGYSLPHISKVINVEEIDYDRFFVCEQENEDAITILSDPTEIQFQYRGKKVVNRLVDLGLGKIAIKMFPRFVLKI